MRVKNLLGVPVGTNVGGHGTEDPNIPKFEDPNLFNLIDTTATALNHSINIFRQIYRTIFNTSNLPRDSVESKYMYCRWESGYKQILMGVG